MWNRQINLDHDLLESNIRSLTAQEAPGPRDIAVRMSIGGDIPSKGPVHIHHRLLICVPRIYLEEGELNPHMRVSFQKGKSLL